MKKLIGMVLCIVLLCAFATPAMAASEDIAFTDDSDFAAGGLVMVDPVKTINNIAGHSTAEVYNAYLYGNVIYKWMRNDSFYEEGISVVLREQDKGCTFQCIATLYTDTAKTQECATIKSPKFAVPNSDSLSPAPGISPDDLPEGTVGKAYYLQLECTNPNVDYSLMDSTLPDGITMSSKGVFEGTPTEAGYWYVRVKAQPQNGSTYGTMEYVLVVKEAVSEYSLEIMNLPKKLKYNSGEKLDMTGLWVRIYTPDGFIDSRDGKYLTYSQKPLVTAGEQKIKLSYEDTFEIFIVTVAAAPAEDPVQNPTEDPADAVKPTEPEGSSAPEETESSVADTEDAEQPVQKPEEDPAAGTVGMAEDEAGKGMPWWGIMLIALGVAAGVVIGIVIKKKFL